MDHSAAQATFIEITFGLNTLFAAYDKFRQVLAAQFADKIKECSAQLKAIEPTAESKRIGRAVMRVEEIANRRLKSQERFAEWMIPVSFICAVACVLALYFDLLGWMGYWNVLLILPLPAYTLFSGVNYWVFLRAKDKKMHNYQSFVRDFESEEPLKLPKLPQSTTGEDQSSNKS